MQREKKYVKHPYRLPSTVPLHKKLYNQKWLLLMLLVLLVPVIWFVIFCYIPMGGLILAF